MGLCSWTMYWFECDDCGALSDDCGVSLNMVASEALDYVLEAGWSVDGDNVLCPDCMHKEKD